MSAVPSPLEADSTNLDFPVVPEPIKVIGDLLIPFQIVSLIKIPLAGYQIGENAYHFKKAPQHLKVLPFLKILEAIGNFFRGIVSVISLCNKFGVMGMRALAASLAPLGGVGSALQVVQGGISLWSLHEVDQQWKKFQALLGKKETFSHEPTSEEIEAAFSSLLTRSRNPMDEYKKKFFGIFNGSTQKKIGKLFDRFKSGAIEKKNMLAAIESLRKHYIQKQMQHICEIALMIIGVVGMLILIFAPTPVAPAAWGLLAISIAATAGFYLYKYIQKKNFHYELKTARAA